MSRMDSAKGIPYHFGWVWQENTKSAAREALEFFTSGFLACGMLWGFMETFHNVLQPVRSLGRHGRWGCLSAGWDFVTSRTRSRGEISSDGNPHEALRVSECDQSRIESSESEYQ